MDAPVSAFLGAMGPLIWKLEVLLLKTSEDEPKRWPRLPKGVRDGIDHLKDDLEEISTYLEDLSELEDPPLTAKCWMKEVRELSYDMEDYIDNLARHSCRTNVKTRSVCKISHVELNHLPRRKKVTWHKQVRIKISEFRIRVQEANQRHKRYELDCLNFRRRYASSGPMLPRQHDEAVDLVIDGQMSGFMDTLARDGDHQLKVVSIVGSEGLGKTTFARMLYNKIKGQFDCRAYVSITRKPNIKKVLRDILTQVQRQEARDDCEDLDIIGRIRKHLLGKRYLIVTDDLWAASAWNIISRAFPEGSQRSRIIVTTQVVDVALTCCCYQPELVFEMKPLDVYHSRKLFFNKIFGSESDCPEMFKEVSYKIVDRCGGSPLATTNMASLLASHSVLLMEQWAYISDSLSTMLRRSSTSEGMRLVLNLSYNNLSHNLKSCLLYLTKYPEGCIICTDDLVKQWVAEGFIEAIEGRDVESVARSYFDELIDRRFIQPACIKYNDEIVSCTVHDTVYDLIAYNSAEENFVMVVDTDRKNVNLSDKVRRLSLNFGDAIYAKKPRNIRSSHVRSLAFSGFFACMPSIAEFKLLRVLNLHLSGHRADDILDLTGISELFQLRYLKVVSDVCIKLPKHMRGLQHLETLDMDAKVTAVPWDIIHLPCLWHLHLPLETNLMDWISDMRSDIVWRLDKLTNMRDLRVTCSTPASNHLEKNMEALGSLLRGLGNLEMLALVPGSSHENTVVCGPSEVVVSWDGFTPPLHLKRFEWSLCSCIFSRVPKWTGEFGNLCVLKIMVKELLRDGVDILKGLPALTALSLYVHAATVERIVFDKAGFLALKFFKFRCSVPWLKFEADAMPNLLKLKLGFNANRVDQHRNTHIIIEHLPCLKQIYAKIGGAGAAAESALRAAVINHPSNPSINIQLADWMFFGHEGRSRATEDKEQDDIVKETAEEVSWEHGEKQANIRISTPSVTPSHLHVSDIQQILKEAQHRWLCPAEICEILTNYRNFRIAPEPPNKPPSGSLFLFDRKVLRYFRKDGHNWRKKNDQKTVKEAHERLKSGSIDVLHCYHAHGEDNINFQRRTYWMLEEDFMHIVLVHYLETKGGKSSRARGNNTVIQEAAVDSPLSQLPSHTIEGESSVSGQASEYEEAESDTYSGGAGYNSFTWMQQHENGAGPVMDSSVFSSYTPASSTGSYQGLHSMAHNTSIYSGNQDNSPVVLNGSSPLFTMNGRASQTDLPSWNEVTKLDSGPVQMPPLQFPVLPEQGTSAEGLGVDYLTFDQVYSDGLSLKDFSATGADGESFWQLSDATGDMPAMENSFPQNDGSLEAAIGYPFLNTQSSNLSDILKDSFKKSDSFTRWMSKELPEVEDSQIQSSSGLYWSTEEADSIIEASSREPLDQFTVAPMVSQHQLFSIVDFAPTWTYVGSKTKILISGRILNNSQVIERCKWSCMFGEVEVQAQMLADGTLLCYSPPHKPGRVPFYITCSNRLACSEVREFEFRPNDSQYMDAPSPHGATNKVYFQIRLDKLVSLGPDEYQATISNPSLYMIDLSKKISSLMMNNDEWSNLLKLADDNELSTDDQKDQFAENLIKEKLHVWLLNKVSVGGKGPSVLDDEGQGVLHLAAALGYDWAIRPTVSAGVNINFRDVHGWTALHWAAFCGRERTVVALIALGAAPGALTDPTPDFPSGSTPADLASANGHKGISGFLAESSLTSHLQALNLKEANMGEISGLPGIGDVTERTSLQPATGDSLGAVRNAAQAAARIYQVFRVQSFQRKQAAQYEDGKGGISDERALSLLSVKPSKPGQDPLHAAATRIQNKFRGWKGRKEFLLIRQRIVKIQAHVRGHQVRKHYRKIVWSVGIVEKVILRWRRRGAGLRGFRSAEGATEGSSGGTSSSLILNKPAGDDYDFLQEGRKQTEERLQKALARVKSMAQYPEARDQYQRILTVVSKMQESQAQQEKVLEESTEMDEADFMSEFKELWDDDTPIPGYY